MTHLPRRRIGMLTPSSNTVLEPVTQAMLAATPSLTAHFSRFKVTEIGLDAGALAQFDDTPILRAAELLSHAKVDVISWNGTSASWLGVERDQRLKERIEDATGIVASTCILSLLDILDRLGAKTQSLVTPYTNDVQERIIATFAARGLSCPGEQHLDIRDNFTFGTVEEAEILRMLQVCLAGQPDAVTILCTNMNGARAAAGLDGQTETIILDSVAVTLWGCLTAVGVRPDSIVGWGQIFSDARLQ